MGGGAAAGAGSDREYFMEIALEEAEGALKEGEVPVGAVVVRDGEVLGKGRNRVIRDCDPTAHAEIVAIREAAGRVGGVDVINNYRLTGADLYVTIEPCIMCAGAIVHARLKSLIYGAYDMKGGAVDSLYKILGDTRLNHRVEVTGGVLEERARFLMQEFFKRKR